MPAGDLCTLADVRLALEVDANETSRDDAISAFITSASAAIVREVNRELAPPAPAATRRLRVDPRRRLGDGTVIVSLAPYDLRTATLVQLDPETATPTTLVEMTDYLLDPMPSPYGVSTALRLAPATSFGSDLVSTFGFAYLDITGDWGFASVPTEAKQACVVTVMSWLRRDVSVLAYAQDDKGELKPAVDPSFTLPPAARRLLWPLYRQRAF